jgi:hypothetical protein
MVAGGKQIATTGIESRTTSRILKGVPDEAVASAVKQDSPQVEIGCLASFQDAITRKSGNRRWRYTYRRLPSSIPSG